MSRTMATMLAALLCAAAFPARAEDPAEVPQVNFYAWSGYLSPTVAKDFTKASGIKVIFDTYASKAEADAKLTAGTSGYDVVVMSASPYLETEIKAGAYEKLDRSQLPSLAAQDPAVTRLLEVADPGHEYAAVYLWGTLGIAYDVDVVKKRAADAPIGSAGLLFNPKVAKKLAGCGIGLIDDPLVVLPMAMQYLGIDPNKAGEVEYKRATDAVMKIRPYVKYIDSNKLLSDLSGKTICLATEWNGDAIAAANLARLNRTGANLDYFVPKEGGLAFVDALAIPKDAPHPASAHAFINAVLQPKAIAQASDEIGYPNAIPASRPLVNANFRDDPRFFPPDDAKARLVTLKALDPALAATVAELWAKVKRGY